ncbi:hypothetical protein THRCLA_08048 [Thraustotheca clavata]|uniref:Secreted protein n=1 Tax=Thraustotheca clavata TaxID=74557 RepID=A0A1V9ZAT6_9STRA|nr:hypothetical protein THRCLA_08048 [Thraustotheca clavata]
MGPWITAIVTIIVLIALALVQFTPHRLPPQETHINGTHLCSTLENLDSYFQPLYALPEFNLCIADSNMNKDYYEPLTLVELNDFFASAACKLLYSSLAQVFLEKMPLCAIDSSGTSIKTLGNITFEQLHDTFMKNYSLTQWMTV